MANITDKAKDAPGIGDKTKKHESVAERVQHGMTPEKPKPEPKVETRKPGLYFTRNISSSMSVEIGVHQTGSRVPNNLPEDEVREFRKKNYIEEVK
jgi:hypothetical protein